MTNERNEDIQDKATFQDEVDHAPASDCEPLSSEAFPIVGIGASAGGLEALKAFFANVSEESGMAYLVVVHMAPRQPSLMHELMQRVARIPVTVARDGETIEPDHVYVIPPDRDLSIYRRSIHLMDMAPRGGSLLIDFFLRSLAQDQQANAAAIILSGTGSDGTLGVKEIKACDGLVMVQSEESATYNGMPRSAINTGVVDMVLAPEEMPEKLIRYFRHIENSNKHRTPPAVGEHKDWLRKVLALLRTQVGHDFSLYKESTIFRRINRRMGVNHIEDPDIYIRFMRENPREAKALFQELLIGVTHFFRDPDSFETLKQEILPDMFAQVENDATFRVWVPGCSTGEEVYSLAMIFRECLDAVPRRVTLQLFGTDIDTNAVDKAREGFFPESIVADVSQERLNRFFVKEGESFRIRKEIRDSIVFSVQDVLKDPPFSRLNLVCCRNLLIYLDSRAQKNLLPLFHYTLMPGGILVLGSSESIGEFTSLFHTLDNKWKIFQRKEVPRGLLREVNFPSGLSAPDGIPATPPRASHRKSDIGQLVQKIVLDRFSPTGVLVDANGLILHILGRTGKYLEATSGPPTNNVLDMAREGLRIELASALRAAASSREQVTRNMVRVSTNGGFQPIDLHVCPLEVPEEIEGRFLIVFQDIAPQSPKPLDQDEPTVQSDTRVSRLEKELQSVRESHQTTIEELESANEELKSTCEELQSSNEELQSTNEELESSKEELQSVNEELQTVNAELQSKLEELSTAQDDLRNILNGTEIATVFVDNAMNIRRFTQKATRIINLITGDLGRPLQHVVNNLAYDYMIQDLAAVLENLAPKEAEVQTSDGKWYNMRIIPYRTTDNRIDGAVLTFSSIDDQKRAQEVLRSANTEMEQTQLLVRSVFDMSLYPLAVLDRQGEIILANKAFERLLQIVGDQVEGGNMFDIASGALEQKGLREALEKGKDFRGIGLEIDYPEGKKHFLACAQRIAQTTDPKVLLLLRLEEVEPKGGLDAA